MTNFGPTYLDRNELLEIPFGSIGENVLINRRVNFVEVENIYIGSNVRIDADVTILATGKVVIGSYVHIGAQSYMVGRAGIILMDFSGLSQGVKLYSITDDYSGRSLTNPTVPRHLSNVQEAQIRIGRHVIIGSGSVVLPGCNIEDGCSIGALSIVKNSLDSWGIYAGCPVKRIKSRSKNLLALEREIQNN